MDPGTRAHEITRLLNEIRAGNSTATEELIPLVLDTLKRVARKRIQNERKDHTLQPTALVNEALLRLLGDESLEWESRAHFFSVASSVMRHILTDYARARGAAKRGGGFVKVPLEEAMACEWRRPEAILALDEALDRLAAYDSRLCKVVEMRFFAGMTEEQIATVLQKSVRTVKRDWHFARDWLYAQLTRPLKQEGRKSLGDHPPSP
jgi:RNA polymerase sigma-70 factor (ECF subfamily)